MSEGQKRYEKFIDKVREAYPGLNKEQQFKKGQEMWNKVKNNPEEIGRAMLTLDAAVAQPESQNTKIWINFTSPPSKKRKDNDVREEADLEIVNVQSDKGI